MTFNQQQLLGQSPARAPQWGERVLRGQIGLWDQEQRSGEGEGLVQGQESDFSRGLRENRYIDFALPTSARQVSEQGYLLADLKLSRDAIYGDTKFSDDDSQVAQNADAIALLERWLDAGLDPEEKNSLHKTKESLDANRASLRKLFP